MIENRPMLTYEFRMDGTVYETPYKYSDKNTSTLELDFGWKDTENYQYFRNLDGWSMIHRLTKHSKLQQYIDDDIAADDKDERPIRILPINLEILNGGVKIGEIANRFKHNGDGSIDQWALCCDNVYEINEFLFRYERNQTEPDEILYLENPQRMADYRQGNPMTYFKAKKQGLR